MQLKTENYLPPYHLVGIGGAGMRGLAWILRDKGKDVQGSDTGKSVYLKALQEKGIKIFSHHRAENLTSARTLIYSSAIEENNPERREAQKRGIPQVSRGEFLAQLGKSKKEIVIAGTHGKTTTTALLSFLFREAGISSSYFIGGEITGEEKNASWDRKELFIAESDESDGSFLYLTPFISIITNIDNDHLNFYKNMETLIHAFRKFTEKTSPEGCILFCLHHPYVKEILPPKPTPSFITYGIEEGILQAKSLQEEKGGTSFQIKMGNHTIKKFFLPLYGSYNVLNALPSIYLGLKFGIPEKTLREIISSFPGVKRRMEFKGKTRNVSIYDDYAHHPTEIAETLKALRKRFPGQIRVVFQPHRYSRTISLSENLAKSLSLADEVVLLPIYAAGENPLPGVDTDIIRKILQHQGAPVRYYKTQEEVVNYLSQSMKNEETIVTLGAGDIFQIGEKLLLLTI
ncbi:MAG: UDP-N-acetylmuramate--L-alanine ligase [Caldiserica bacterium]|nr:UDP-N-acetylmuramate--L-alanine ligase [Caldisericota bacterium]